MLFWWLNLARDADDASRARSRAWRRPRPSAPRLRREPRSVRGAQDPGAWRARSPRPSRTETSRPSRWPLQHLLTTRARPCRQSSLHGSRVADRHSSNLRSARVGVKARHQQLYSSTWPERHSQPASNRPASAAVHCPNRARAAPRRTIGFDGERSRDSGGHRDRFDATPRQDRATDVAIARIAPCAHRSALLVSPKSVRRAAAARADASPRIRRSALTGAGARFGLRLGADRALAMRGRAISANGVCSQFRRSHQSRSTPNSSAAGSTPPRRSLARRPRLREADTRRESQADPRTAEADTRQRSPPRQHGRERIRQIRFLIVRQAGSADSRRSGDQPRKPRRGPHYARG